MKFFLVAPSAILQSQNSTHWQDRWCQYSGFFLKVTTSFGGGDSFIKAFFHHEQRTKDFK